MYDLGVVQLTCFYAEPGVERAEVAREEERGGVSVRQGVLLAAVLCFPLVASCSVPDLPVVAESTPSTEVESPAPVTSSTSPSVSTLTPSGTLSPSPSVSSSSEAEASAPSPTPVPEGAVAWKGSGSFDTIQVDGAGEAPAGAKVRKLSFAVEKGIDVDGQAFAKFVLETLNDPRSWTHDGFYFVASDQPQTRIVLASPATSAAMCRPLDTGGKLSCRNGSRVIFTNYRWASGHRDYGDDLIGYRRYLVNHEVGHSLGHGHKPCPGKGKIAPVMMQQTKGLLGCVKNSWPYPS